MVQIPSFKEAFFYWLRLGFISFGGPTGQIAMMHKEVVERKKWLSEDHFLHALNFCMLLPGPEAQQLATYIGLSLNRTFGGIAAGVLFVLPSVFVLWGLSWIYSAYGAVPSVAALFFGLKPAVVAIVAEAVIRIGKKSLKTKALYFMAAISFILIFFMHVPFPVIICSAALAGYYLNTTLTGQTSNGNNQHTDSFKIGFKKQLPHTLKVAAVGLTLWFAPIGVLGAIMGWSSIFVNIGILFSKAAVVTFGGAYAVLGYIGQQAVNHYGWLTQEQMMDGLALAETTPGPLIMVNQFVAYVAGYVNPQGLSPSFAGAAAGLLATWATFVPSTMFIFITAPYIDAVRQNKQLSSALTAITAAVVGVVLNLAVNFTYHTLIPEGGGFQWYALSASAAAFVGMMRFKLGMIPVIACSAIMGFVWKTLF